MESSSAIVDLLRATGMMPHYKGYAYLQYALKMICEEPEKLYNISSQIYTEVADTFQVKPSSVGRSIRFAIKKTWQSTNTNRLGGVFSHYIGDWTPTNREFLSIMTDLLVNNIKK